mmetsp:Transcript_12882/g.12775  ORF Transcript_12882/g.12775 Transcript_12882/m.12775 type:complete len:98 (+) Transcript_12882:489-782(+)
MLVVIFIGMSYFNTILEEYYTGGLFLGLINPITDGSILLIGVYVYLGFFGSSEFTYIYNIDVGSTIFSITLAELFLYFAIVLCVSLLFLNTYNVLNH